MAIESKSNQYGTVFDGWQITKKLGKGSNGKTAVYQLSRKDDDWEETCALKVITLIEEKGVYEELSPSRQEEYKQALKQRISDAKQEVRLMEKLRGNTNIVDYLDHKPRTWKKANSFGCDMMIRMELLHDLRSEIASGRIFTEAEIIKIGKDICNALILCHSKGILHRDIKPENIFFNDDGNYKLGDFGVSRILDACPDATASTGIGTYEYWPAEQMTGRYDKRVDIYSLGLVLYELSNRNRLPFAASTYLTGSEVPMRLAGKPLPAPSEASSLLAQVILKACAFKPEERYQSAEEFLKALNQLTSSVQNAASYQVVSQSLKQTQAHEDYATALAKELGLPEDIFADDTYKTAPAEANEIPPKTSFATRPARQTQNSYHTAPAEQDYTKSEKKHTKSKRMLTIVLSEIIFCLIIPIGVMIGSLQFKSDKNEKVNTSLTSPESSVNELAIEVNTTETLPYSTVTETGLEETASVVTPVPAQAHDDTTSIPLEDDLQNSQKKEIDHIKELKIKTTYCIDDTLDADNLGLTAIYESGKETLITSGFACSPTTLSKAGTQEVTVYYDGITSTFDVEVLDFYELDAHISNISGEGYNVNKRVYWVLYIVARYNGNYVKYTYNHNLDL